MSHATAGATSSVGDLGGPVLLVTGKSERLPDVVRVLRSVTPNVEVRAHLEETDGNGAYRLVIVYYDDLAEEERERVRSSFQGKARARLILLSGGQCKDDYVDLFRDQVLYNLLTRRSVGDTADLVVTIRKILSQDLFGIDKYFTWGIHPRQMTLTRASERRHALAEAESFARSIGVPSRLAQQFTFVVDEFLTNAFYNAPTDENGVHKYRHVARGSEVILDEGRSVQLTFACDGRRLGVSTTDPFGSLSADQVLTYLGRCFQRGEDQIEDKEGGAGLGFFMIFGALSHLAINIAPGKRTEMVGLIDLGMSFRDFAEATKSFNIFVAVD